MKLWTYAEVEKKVRLDGDLQDVGNFISEDEMAGYCNDAVDIAEAEILKLSEDYFLTRGTLTLVNGTASYALPENIYAQKIREVLYVNGASIAPIPRIRDPHKFYQRAQGDASGTAEGEYSYMLVNTTAQAMLELVPAARESGQVVQVWYIRNAARVPMIGEGSATRSTQLATVLDIPEWTSFVIAYMKWACLMKDRDPRAVAQAEFLKTLKEGMVDALTQRTPDNEDEIPMDMGFYGEHN